MFVACAFACSHSCVCVLVSVLVCVSVHCMEINHCLLLCSLSLLKTNHFFLGRAVGTQQVERMEPVSLRGRRQRRIPDEDEGESLDDMLKTVDSKPAEKEETKNEDADKVGEKEAGSRRESVTRLPTGKQIRQQAVREWFFFCEFKSSALVKHTEHFFEQY